MGTIVNRGEIWNFRFDRPDKQRPVLILTRQEMIEMLHTVTVAPLTGTIRGVPSEVVLGTEVGAEETFGDQPASLRDRTEIRDQTVCRNSFSRNSSAGKSRNAFRVRV